MKIIIIIIIFGQCGMQPLAVSGQLAAGFLSLHFVTVQVITGNDGRWEMTHHFSQTGPARLAFLSAKSYPASPQEWSDLFPPN